MRAITVVDPSLPVFRVAQVMDPPKAMLRKKFESYLDEDLGASINYCRARREVTTIC